MMRSLTWSYPQKSPYSFDTAPAAAHRPRRVNTHSTKLQAPRARSQATKNPAVASCLSSSKLHHAASSQPDEVVHGPRLARLPARLLPDTVKSCAGWSLPQASFMCLDFGG